MDNETREYLKGMEERINQRFEKVESDISKLRREQKERMDDLYKSIVTLIDTHGVVS